LLRSLSLGDNPSSFQEAVESNEWQGWTSAKSAKMESLHKNSVWELVPKSKYRKVIGSKLIFQMKESINEKEAPTYKVRLVAKGFSQKKGVDYDEIFSPMVKRTSIQVLLSLVAQPNMELE